MSLNKCMIIGNLGRDPEMRYTPSGQAVTQFTVATNRRYRDQQGEWQEDTEWFRIVVWGPQAERVAENLRKGNKVYIEGRLQTRQWEGQDGQKRYTTELVANQVKSLERRERSEEGEDFGGGEGGGGQTSRPRQGGQGPGGQQAAAGGYQGQPGQSAGGQAQGGQAAGGQATGGQPGGEPGYADDLDDLPF